MKTPFKHSSAHLPRRKQEERLAVWRSSCVPQQQVEVDATGIKLKIKKTSKNLAGSILIG